MARRKTSKSKTAEEKIIQEPKISQKNMTNKPTQITKTVTCTINSSYITECPDSSNFTTSILLDGNQIEGEITNTNGKYKGIKAVNKNSKLIIYTGKHGLSSIEDIISGELTIQFTEI